MTKTERIQVSTEAGRGLRVVKLTPKHSYIALPNKDQIILWDGKPYACTDGAYVYLLAGTTGAPRAALDKWDLPIMLLAVDTLEYHIGQAFSKAGLMLVRRLDP